MPPSSPKVIDENKPFDKSILLDEMVKANQKRRRELLGVETFEPIDIDYGFEDAVLFDSDNEPLCFEKPEEDNIRRESLKPEIIAETNVSGIPDFDCGIEPFPSPRLTPKHRGSICSHKASPHPHRHPPRVDDTAGMAISDDEDEEGDIVLQR
jgi:hypothetical protein